jgi:hypothetical protein
VLRGAGAGACRALLRVLQHPRIEQAAWTRPAARGTSTAAACWRFAAASSSNTLPGGLCVVLLRVRVCACVRVRVCACVRACVSVSRRSKEETDYLLDLLEQYDLRFVVVADRYNVSAALHLVAAVRGRAAAPFGEGWRASVRACVHACACVCVCLDAAPRLRRPTHTHKHAHEGRKLWAAPPPLLTRARSSPAASRARSKT